MKKINPFYYFIPLLHVVVIVLLVFSQWKSSFVGEMSAEPKVSKKIEKKVDSSSTEEKEVGKKVAKTKVEVKKAPIEINEVDFENIEESGKKSKFKKNIGEFEVYSKKKVKEAKNQVKVDSAMVACSGILFSFDDKKDLLWVSKEGKQSYLTLKGITYNRKKAVFSLSNNVQVYFQNEEAGKVSLAVSAKESGALYIKIAAVEGKKLSGEIGGALFSVENKRKQTVLTQSASSSNRLALHLFCEGDSDKVVPSARVFVVEGGSTYNAVLSEITGDKNFDKSFYQFRQKAYAGWLGERYNPNSGTWKDADGRDFLSPDLVDFLVAEAFNRNEPNRALDMIQHSNLFSFDLINGQRYENLYVHEKIQSLSTALLFGQLKRSLDQSKSETVAFLQNFRKSGMQEDLALLENPYLVEEILLWGSASDLELLFSKVFETKKIQDSRYLAVAALHAVYLAKLFPERSSQIKPMIESNLKRLAGFISFSQNGATIANDNEVSLFHTGIAAFAFYGAKEFLKDSSYDALAGGLMQTVLSKIDTVGIFPKTLRFFDLEKNSKERVLPETLYPWLKGQSCAFNFSRVQTQKSGTLYILHRAKSMSITQDAVSVNLNFSHWYQAGADQYAVAVLNNIIVKGLKSFTRVSMWSNRLWPADRGFESWRVGYFFWESETLATIMLRHRSSQETLSFFWEEE